MTACLRASCTLHVMRPRLLHPRRSTNFCRIFPGRETIPGRPARGGKATPARAENSSRGDFCRRVTPLGLPACALPPLGVFARAEQHAVAVRPRCKRYLLAPAAPVLPANQRCPRYLRCFFFGGRLARSFLSRRSRRSFCAVFSPRFSLGLSPTKGFTSLRNSTLTGVANRSKRSRNTLARYRL